MKIIKILIQLIVLVFFISTCSNFEMSGGASEIGNSTNGIMANPDLNDTMGTSIDPF